MTNYFKLEDKLNLFATKKYWEDDGASDVLSFLENLQETTEENPNGDGEDFTSDNHCKGVIGYVLDVGRCSEEFIKELEAIIAEHFAAREII